MRARYINNITKVAAAGAIISAVFGIAGASAQTSAPAAGCFVEPAKLPNADIQAFLDAPDALLTQFPSGGLTLSSQVRSLAGSSADALAPLLALAKQASPSQAAAIGAGLARVARSCVAADPEYVAQIQAAIADVEVAGLETAFTSGLNETQTAALGGGAGGGAAAAGGASAIGGGGASDGGAGTSGDGSTSTPTSVQTFSLRNVTYSGDISCSTPNC
ncbi:MULTISPECIES: hypothetical protein [Rhizobium]|uniref:hypothetical protein n=1 Tax=Rhizobium TaxID=379 RepID=UPI002897F65A